MYAYINVVLPTPLKLKTINYERNV
jgi:hypothetical protein